MTLVSGLLRTPVRCGDEHIGYVIDARFIESDSVPAGPTLLGLIVGPRRGVSFLGYERNRVRRPTLIAAALRRRQSGCFLLDLGDIEAITSHEIQIRPDFTRWNPMSRS